jgi:hypothetical protein
MKKVITNYTFNAASKTVTFSDYASIDLKRVLLITNVTTNTIIYNFAVVGKGGSAATNVLTLTYDTTAMNNADNLQIFYDDPQEFLGDAGFGGESVGASIKSAAFSLSGAQQSTAMDLANYAWVAVEVTTNNGTLTFQTSVDNTNWRSQPMTNASSTDGASSSTNTNTQAVIFSGPLVARYFRVSLGSGAATGTILATSIPRTLGGLRVSASTTTVQGGAAQDAAITGSPVPIGLRASYAEPTAMSADGDVVYPWVDRRGRQLIKAQSGTGTLSNVASSATNVTVLAANTSRLGAIIVNDSTAILYLKMGATASATSYTAKLQPDDYYEVPFGYTGILDGIWASANGNARVTELT